MMTYRLLFLLCLVASSIFSGCAEVQPPASTLSDSFVVSTMENVPRTPALTPDLDMRACRLAERANFDKPMTYLKVQEQPIEQGRLILGLQKQLRERDHHIAVLRAQLEALKMIDEENQSKHRKVKPPASLRTADHSPDQ